MPAPELLENLRHALLPVLCELLPGLDVPAREQLAADLVARTRCISGHYLSTARGVELADLAGASLHYTKLARFWGPTLAPAASDHPAAWITLALARLLDVARDILGGEYVPGDKSDLEARDAAMWAQFRGDITASALHHNISYQRARQILVAKMREERQTRQGSLF